VTGKEIQYLQEAVHLNRFSGDGLFSRRCQQLIEQALPAKKVFLTSSCTHALEMAAMLADIKTGDEIIMPSYTFVSTANAFVLRGARIVFVDIRPDTMNIDESCIEQAITEKTRAIVPVHYAGVACEMDRIMEIAGQYGLWVIEDAAQALFSRYKGRALGTIGDLGCFSFHETKNYSCGEGGAISINHERHIERAEILREKGTDKGAFLRGEVDKYTWQDIGSSFSPSELQCAYLYANLEMSHRIDQKRHQAWDRYYTLLQPLAEAGKIALPIQLPYCRHNAHMFYLKTGDARQRQALARYLKKRNIESAFHYIPLHLSPMGRRHGQFSGPDRFTRQESEKLLRLPLYYTIGEQEVDRVSQAIIRFYG